MSDLEKLKMLIEKYAVFTAVEWPDGRKASVYDECMKLISSLENNGWISVDDRMPEDEDEMLVCFGEDVTTAQYNPWGGECHEKWYEWQDIPGYGSQKGEVIGVTHWMPLPEPPKQ